MKSNGHNRGGGEFREIGRNLTPDDVVSVICPMFNESARIEQNIGLLLGRLRLLDNPVELIVVNDGSTDDSCELVRSLLADNEDLRLITYSSNRGRGYAIRRGLEHARGAVIVVTESDLSWGEEIVSLLLDRLIAADLDAVVASPHAPGGRLENVPWERRLFTIIGNHILRWFMPVKLTMYTGMTRAYRREAIAKLLLTADGKELHLEIVSQLAALGCAIGEIPAVLRWPAETPERRKRFRPWHHVRTHLLFALSESPHVALVVCGSSCLVLSFILGTSVVGSGPAGNGAGSGSEALWALFSATLGTMSFLAAVVAFALKKIERQQLRLMSVINNASTDTRADTRTNAKGRSA